MYVKNIENKVSNYKQDYIQFMDIESFPEYILQTKEASLSVADSKGFDTAATTFYNADTDRHTLIVSTNLELPKYLIFHEFTHILDTELYAKGDKVKYAQLSGYTEYHASQIELMQMLGANKWSQQIEFSMKDIVGTFSGKKTVQEYLDIKWYHAVELFGRSDFPANIEMLKTAFGVLFNFYGLQSICELYATDYSKHCGSPVFSKFIPTHLHSMMNALMHGWFNKGQIEICEKLYINIIYLLIQDYKLA